MNTNYYCIIMAGGVGSRFWPVSRNSKPKQFLDILGTGKTFLQQTFERFVQIIPAENILVVTSESYKDLVCEQLPMIPVYNVLLEPYKRNTAPCIAYATYKLFLKNPNATVVVAPSDHYITNESVFLETVLNAMNYASKNDMLFTLGIKPTRPETGYGYIQTTKNAKDVDGHVALEVKTFTEKPNKELAQVFLESGEFLWNSGIFVWNLKTIKQELEKWLPEVTCLFDGGEKYYYTDKEQIFINHVYEECNAVSIDYGVMEKTSIAWVFKTTFGWSDLGTWESLFMHSDKDENNNLVRVEELMMDKMSNSIIMSTEKDKLITVKGLDNYMIVNTDDVLMICPRDEVRFKNILTDLTVNEKTKFQ